MKDIIAMLIASTVCSLAVVVIAVTLSNNLAEGKIYTNCLEQQYTVEQCKKITGVE